MRKNRKAMSVCMLLLAFVLTCVMSRPTTVLAAKKKVTLKYTAVTSMTAGETKDLYVQTDGSASYKSSNKKVVTVSKGKITAKKAGTAKITITAKKKGCKSVSKKFTVKVAPKQANITSVKSSGTTINVSVQKISGVTGYQYRYATNSSFSKSTTKTEKKTSFKFNGSKGNVYYIAVRGYVKSGSKKIYGAWSAVKTCSLNGDTYTGAYGTSAYKKTIAEWRSKKDILDEITYEVDDRRIVGHVIWNKSKNLILSDDGKITPYDKFEIPAGSNTYPYMNETYKSIRKNWVLRKYDCIEGWTTDLRTGVRYYYVYNTGINQTLRMDGKIYQGYTPFDL